MDRTVREVPFPRSFKAFFNDRSWNEESERELALGYNGRFQWKKNQFCSISAHRDVGLCKHLSQTPHHGQPCFDVLAQMSVVEQMLSCKLP